MTVREPFPLAEDYEDAEPFELHQRDSNSPPSFTDIPMTMPQRMVAVEQRLMQQSKQMAGLTAKVDKILKAVSWKNTVKTVAYPVVSVAGTMAATHYPQLKPLFEAFQSLFTG